MSRQILSIDIRNSALAAVVLNTGLTNNTIEACAYVPISADSEDASPLRTALNQLLARLNIGKPGVVVGVPSDRIFYRTISVPFKEDKKIRQILPFELEPSFPIAVEHLIIDYQQSDDPDDGELLTVAVDRQHIDDITADLAIENLRPQLVVPGGFPLALGLAHYHERLEDQALLLDIGASKATLFALDARKIALVRSLTSYVLSDAGVEALALNIRQTLTAFTDARAQGFTPGALYLSGPAFSNEAASKRLAEALELPAHVVDLRAAVPKLETAEHLNQWQPHLYDAALAMALIEAEGRACPNFHRSSSLFRNYWTTYRPYVRGPATLMILVILLSLGGVLIDSHMLQNRVDRINAQIETLFASTFPGTRRVGDALDQMKSELKKAKSSGIDAGQSGPQVRTIDVMYQLSQLIPKDVDVVFSRMVMGSDGLTISGETDAFNIVDDIKNRLEKSDIFKQVTIASANMDKSGKKVLFKLKIDL